MSAQGQSVTHALAATSGVSRKFSIYQGRDQRVFPFQAVEVRQKLVLLRQYFLIVPSFMQEPRRRRETA
jgi:hypothetical protein